MLKSEADWSVVIIADKSFHFNSCYQGKTILQKWTRGIVCRVAVEIKESSYKHK